MLLKHQRASKSGRAAAMTRLIVGRRLGILTALWLNPTS
jgi:hypothetical protein